MKVYRCGKCGYLVSSDVILALTKMEQPYCVNPGGCDEPFEKFTLLLDDEEEFAVAEELK